MERARDELGIPMPSMRRPEHGIGWTPDRFRLSIWFPNCGVNRRPWEDGQVYTWEQATERARRLIEGAGDPVFSVTITTVDPLNDGARGMGCAG